MKDSQKFALEAPGSGAQYERFSTIFSGLEAPGSQLGPFLENWNGPPACSSIPRRSPAGKVILQTKLLSLKELDTVLSTLLGLVLPVPG